LDARQQRIADDLSGVLEGELRFDRIAQALYGTDASLYQVPPLGVAFPRHVGDVVALAKYAEETRLPLVPRGAGTGLAGGALGEGLIVDFSRHMREIERVDGQTVRVQPGVVRDQLNRELAKQGRYFPPDPSNSSVTTVGGMLGVDAAGSHAVRVGSTRDHVRSLEIVLVGGQTFEVGDEEASARMTVKAPAPGDEPPSEVELSKRRLVNRVAQVLSRHRELIQQKQPPLIRNCAGYYLRSVLTEDHLHVPRLLVGSEGTLAMFTAATLHTSPLPPHRGVALLLFGRMDSALGVVQSLSEQQPSACDLIDRRLLSLGREADPELERLIPQTAEAALIVEQTGYTEPQVRQRIRMAIDAARAVDSSVRLAAEAYTPEDVEFLWSLPQKVVPNLIRLVGQTRPQPFVEDIAVPPPSLQDVLKQAQRVLQKHQVTASLYAHAASGQIHLRPFLPLPTESDAPRIEAVARELYDVVLAQGGTISGEHGDGLSRTAFLRTQYGPLYRVFKEVKDLFDPHHLLNPGKIVSDDPHLTVKHFRPLPRTERHDGPGPAPADIPSPSVPAAERPAGANGTVTLQLHWTLDDVADAALRCNGCGVCRTQHEGLRMCPLFRLSPREEASPRAKANVMRSQLAGLLSAGDLASEEMKQLANLCFNCKQCQLECPSNVDIPHLMIEAKAQYVAANGLRRTDWILSRAHSFGALGGRLAPFSNWLLNNRPARWLMERMFGIARRRKLPRFASRSFLASVRKSLSKRQGPLAKGTVVYFVDHFANHHDPQLAWAFVRLLEHLGTPVHVPAGQTASGLAMISAGDLDAARELAEQNIRALAEFAREGHTIVCTEPAAALAITQEYPRLIDHPDVKVVAERTVEAGAFLAALLKDRPDDRLFSPLPLTAAYHAPCHSRALHNESPYVPLLERIPDLRFEEVSLGCSGMAGAFGLTAENFDTSLAIGRGLIDRMAEPTLQAGITECSSCKLQMEQGSSTPTLHPIKLLALACGLMPELRLKLAANTKRLLVS
jgi:FAD/FMN-containing dehydrogenase/Fe-S oxidoreductase